MEIWSTNAVSNKEEALEQIKLCENMNGEPLEVVEEENVIYATWLYGGTDKYIIQGEA